MSVTSLSVAVAEHLKALEQSLLDVDVRSDTERVSALLADDFMEFGSSGRVWTREMTTAALALETPDGVTTRIVSDLSVRPLADGVALVTYTVTRQSPNAPDVRTLRSSIWRNADNAWRMVFHQGTVVPEEVTA